MSAAPPMTVAQAQQKAATLYGVGAYLHDRGHHVPEIAPRYLVGYLTRRTFVIAGEGATWEEAFEAAAAVPRLDAAEFGAPPASGMSVWKTHRSGALVFGPPVKQETRR